MALRAEISALKIEEESDKKKLELMQTQARENWESLEETAAEFVDAAGVLTSAIDTADRNDYQFLASFFQISLLTVTFWQDGRFTDESTGSGR